MASSASFERVVPASKALEVFYEILNEFKLTFTLFSEGQQVKTHFCEIESEDGVINSGMGKGLGAQSKASAMYEALEHYFHERDDPILHEKKYLLNDSCVLSKSSLLLERVKNINSPIELYSTKYEKLGSEFQSEFLPIFLTDVNYKSGSEQEALWLKDIGLRRYSTNSGTASGLTLEESLLHGLLELIERDSIGMELLGSVIRENPKPVKILRLDSISDEVMEVLQAIQIESGGDLVIYEITSDIGVPTYLSQLSVDGKKYFGSGASLNSNYAVERSVLESLQVFHSGFFVEKGLIGEEKKQINILLPKYSKAYLENGVFDYCGGEVYVEIKEPLEFSEQSVFDQLTYLVESLLKHNIDTYFRVIKKANDCSFYVAQVVAPRLERFHLISHGLPVAPGFRGRQSL